MTETCDRCGAELRIGMFPFCSGNPSDHVHSVNSVEAVTWPGGKTFENLGHEPVTFYHRSDYEKYLRNHRIEECVRNAGPMDKYAPRWVAMSQATLDGAKAMLERVGKATKTDPPPTYIESFTCTVTEESGTVYAKRGTFGVFEDACRTQR